MRRWKKKTTHKGTVYFAKIAPEEARVLRSLAHYVIDQFHERQNATPRDELSEITGIITGPTHEPDSALLQRLLPNFIHPATDISAGNDAYDAYDANDISAQENQDNINSAMRSLYENDIITAKELALSTIVDTTPELGGDILLDEDQAQLWLRGINDLRLALGSILNVDDNGDYARNVSPQMLESVAVYDWLSLVLDLLIAVIST